MQNESFKKKKKKKKKRKRKENVGNISINLKAIIVVKSFLQVL